MYEEHPSFEPPPQEAVLWRYLNFTKFVSLLDRKSLFFARADKLGDPFEGSFAKKDIIELRDAYAELPEYIKAKLSDQEKYRLQLISRRSLFKEHRKMIFANCWHESAHESAAMWRLYSGEYEGVAIKTNFGSFAQSLPGEEAVYVGKIKYIDYDKDSIPQDNIFNPYLCKRKSFEHEREVRAVIYRDDHHHLYDNIDDTGKYREVEIASLVKEVVVAPYAQDWFLELVASVSALYGLGVKVRRSSLADEPNFGKFGKERNV